MCVMQTSHVTHFTFEKHVKASDTNIVSQEALEVQQCFGVVYHALTTLRRVYFARAAFGNCLSVVNS